LIIKLEEIRCLNHLQWHTNCQKGHLDEGLYKSETLSLDHTKLTLKF